MARVTDINKELIVMLPRMRRFGMSLTRQMHLADDLVQDTCERAIQRADQYEMGTRFDSWVFSIMHSIWKNQLRSQARRATDGDDVLETVADDTAGNLAEDRLMLDVVNRALLALPEDQRAAIMIVSVEGYAYREAAEVLEVPIGTVMSRIARGRLALTKAIAA